MTMAEVRIRIWMLGVVAAVLLQMNHARAVSVSYDQRALKLDGQRRMLISGSIHYPRSTPTVSAFISRVHPSHSSACFMAPSPRHTRASP
jgi:hypothetical protein